MKQGWDNIADPSIPWAEDAVTTLPGLLYELHVDVAPRLIGKVIAMLCLCDGCLTSVSVAWVLSLSDYRVDRIA